MTEQPTTSPAAAESFASWPQRVGAYIIDALPTTGALVLLTALFGESETSDSSASFQLNGLPALVFFVVAVAWFVYNWVFRQGTTGQTVGKKVLGIAVHAEHTDRPIGPGLSFARQIVHIVDALPCLIGFLWPIWDRERRTFADMIMSTRVHKV